jgi:hypothetical protein
MPETGSKGPELSDMKDQQAPGLRIYRAPWKGHLVVACGKCQKKRRRRGDAEGLGKLKKTFKRAKGGSEGFKLRVATVSCLKLCPKDGVSVCTQGQLGRGECSIVQSQSDVNALYALCAERGL